VSQGTTAPALAGLGLDLQDVLADNDEDEEVELTEDDWKDPHFLVSWPSSRPRPSLNYPRISG